MRRKLGKKRFVRIYTFLRGTLPISPGLKSMSEPRKLNNHATSSSIVTTIALAFFFSSSSRTFTILSVWDCPRYDFVIRTRKGWKKRRRMNYTAIYLVEMENQRCRSCGSVLPYGVHRILGQRNKLGIFG
jgi:hypothetical protein